VSGGELERRLRELVDNASWNDDGRLSRPNVEWSDIERLCRAAARIGAEAEREVCAAITASYNGCDVIAREIRARAQQGAQ
jgi:hypothetical protein